MQWRAARSQSVETSLALSTGWLASGAVGLDTAIWAEGCSNWEPVAKIPELQVQLKVAEAALTALKAAAPNPTAAGVHSLSWLVCSVSRRQTCTRQLFMASQYCTVYS